MNQKILFWVGVTAVIIALTIGHAGASHLSASLAIDPTANLSTDRIVVTVHGTYTCGPILPEVPFPGTDFGNLFVDVRQASGQSITEGFGNLSTFSTLICDGALHPFQVLVPASEIPWHGGLARVNASISVQDCDQFFQCENASSTVDAQLKIQGGGR